MPWHYYLSQGLPLLSWSHLPWIVMGVEMVKPPSVGVKFINQTLRSGLIRTVAFFSLLAHKEVRFILPLLPILHYFAALGHLSSPAPPQTPKPARPFKALAHQKQHSNPPSLRPVDKHSIPLSRVCILALASWMPALYLNTFHSNAQVAVLDYLRHIPSSELRSVGFLMPCHSTPWQSHLHRQDLEELKLGGSGQAGRLWFLTCEPPIS